MTTIKNTDEAIMDALSPHFPGAVWPNKYTGKQLEYIVYNFVTLPVLHAESKPHAARHLVQVHWYLPDGKSPSSGKLKICRALYGGGFSWPSIENASDESGQHYVFECEYINGGGLYGYT